MNEVKHILTSRTVWAGLLAMVAGVAQVYGYEFSADAQANLVTVLTGVLAVVGGGGAIFGRVAATKKIG